MKYFRLFTLTVFHLFLQNTFSQDVYYDSLWNETSKEDAVFYRTIDTLSGNTYLVKDYYTDGSIQMEGTYSSIKKEIKDGLFSWYSHNGIKTKEAKYQNGQEHGMYKIWYEAGQQKLIGKMYNGKRDSTWVWWYENGELWTVADYDNGKINGKWTTFYKNGVKKETYRMTNGKFTGHAVGWDSNGVKIFEMNLDSKLKNGSFALFYPNGNLKAQGKIRKGKPDGEWIAFYSNGNKKAVGLAVNGYKSGQWYYYNPDGTLDHIMVFDKKNQEKVDDFTKDLKKLLNGN